MEIWEWVEVWEDLSSLAVTLDFRVQEITSPTTVQRCNGTVGQQAALHTYTVHATIQLGYQSNVLVSDFNLPSEVIPVAVHSLGSSP